MSGYHFALTCPHCGGEVIHRDDTNANPAPDRCSVEVWCEACLIRWRLELVAVPVEITHLPESTRTARERASEACGTDLMSSFA